MISCHQLSQMASDYKFNPRVPLRLYLKTCVSLLEEAQESFQSGNVQRSYVMYLRYLDLCTKKLPAHPELLGPQADPDRILARKGYMQLLKLEVPAILKISEDLRLQLERSFAQQAKSLASNVAKQRPLPKERVEEIKLPSTFDESRFKQSISTLQRHTERATAAFQQKESHLVYPELPQLSHPFYAS
ncbi:LAME_0A07690g1_1 [Lachancea meyersii CBS 8951]|uniref:Regulator of free ubiquitin chains 1 n=1 Tax=Lachancea meyersii CBS 8951 TaxID=1266667 RepID=A0A1G4IRM4_9SACH|nr:LAME_0A07690g1_1 [Lachancea meyersii CBS 8951]